MSREQYMSPFGIGPLDLIKVEFEYTVRQPRDVIRRARFYGSGKVVMEEGTLGASSVPKESPERLKPLWLIRILDLLEGEGFMGLEDVLGPEGDQTRREIRVVIPGHGEKTVVVAAGLRSPAFERCEGAIKMALATVFPERKDAGIRESTRIEYAYYSAKTGAGRQELRIEGSGVVKLFLTRSANDPRPATQQGIVPRDAVGALVNFMIGEGFLQLKDHYETAGRLLSQRVLRLINGTQSKTVELDEPVSVEFEQFAGAVKLAAALGVAEVLNQRFFPNL